MGDRVPPEDRPAKTGAAADSATEHGAASEGAVADNAVRDQESVVAGPAQGEPATDRGASHWAFLHTFLAARRQFLSIHRLYDQRVLAAADRGRVDRVALRLAPRELYGLFHLGRLEHLRDERLHPLRRLAPRIFGSEGDVGLMDAYCGHIFHEVSILSREHRSVGRFVRRADPRRYRLLFEEVRGYYPERLRRVKRFFALATRRLDELLPLWNQERIFVRSAYLFGDAVARLAWKRGRFALYERMYPGGGVIRGFGEAAASFEASGFVAEAREAGRQAEATAATLGARRTLGTAERDALAAVRAVVERLPRESTTPS